MGLISNGTTLLDAGALDSGVPTGVMTLLATATASSSATIDFTSGIDSTYKEYVFKFINIHPATDNANFSFQVDVGTDTSYAQTITSASFQANHKEDDSETGLVVDSNSDQHQGTSFQVIQRNVGNFNDNGACGTLTLFNPSSTVFTKHFISTTQAQQNDGGGMSQKYFMAGYVNTTTALTRVRFKFDSGNIDSGTFKLYGIK